MTQLKCSSKSSNIRFSFLKMVCGITHSSFASFRQNSTLKTREAARLNRFMLFCKTRTIYMEISRQWLQKKAWWSGSGSSCLPNWTHFRSSLLLTWSNSSSVPNCSFAFPDHTEVSQHWWQRRWQLHSKRTGNEQNSFLFFTSHRLSEQLPTWCGSTSLDMLF